MYRPLAPCPGCHRHVLTTERACPFCGAAAPSGFAPSATVEAPRRASRSALAALGAALTLTACGATTTNSGGDASVDVTPDAPRDASSDEGGVAPAYGDPPPRDAGRDVVDDEGGPMAEYGAPPPRDAGRDVVDDDGGSVDLYGAPPPRDAGTDEGAILPAYGISPVDGG